MTKKLSAVSFRDPLICALAEMAENTTDPVRHTDTYDKVLSLMGIPDKDAYGSNDGSGQPMVYKWIQWANKALRKQGLTELKGRGLWALTTKGLARASELTSDAVSEELTSAAPKYSDDPYFVSLACQSTLCFGKYSSHASAVCVDCPLKNVCRDQQNADYARLALVLNAEDDASDASDALDVPEAPPNSTNIDFSKADVITSRVDIICEACGKLVLKNEQCRWLSEDKHSGIFHMKCSGGPEGGSK